MVDSGALTAPIGWLAHERDCTMPRCFIHHQAGDQTMWDRVGCELPDLRMAPDRGQTTALWMHVFAGQLQPGQILVVANERGKVLFVTSG